MERTLKHKSQNHHLQDTIDSASIEDEYCSCGAPLEDDFLASFNATESEQNQTSTIIEDSIERPCSHPSIHVASRPGRLGYWTSFLTKAGFSCDKGDQYFSFSGDDTRLGGFETVKIFLGHFALSIVHR